MISRYPDHETKEHYVLLEVLRGRRYRMILHVIATMHNTTSLHTTLHTTHTGHGVVHGVMGVIQYQGHTVHLSIEGSVHGT